MKKPVIGLTLDWREQGTYSQYPWYALRQNYADAIAHVGGVPLALPYAQECVLQYAALLDGLIITGGAFDVDPTYYGKTLQTETSSTIPQRTAFEIRLAQAFLRTGKPVLGICGGHQLLNVVAGGTLIQHIPDAVPCALAHEQPNPRHETSHDIAVVPGTRLHDLLGQASGWVNSAHHQAIDEIAPGFIVNARAPDGVIEGIEHPTHAFCMGVQWHPEFLITSHDTQILQAFVDACTL